VELVADLAFDGLGRLVNGTSIVILERRRKKKKNKPRE
jgi:hypothetical protein